ncbi:hypothetical protein MXM82_14420 [Pseudomonas asiatica]|uniref:hypothetical protein n=1 Tax=Pseudomonas asiatica TaxID=2219225 RepID=UPI002DC03F65|nr:hypothetical protein [Pseudomonas asiatica]MEB6590325.1 hypothetical protein [Pseudomonas asiatica]
MRLGRLNQHDTAGEFQSKYTAENYRGDMSGKAQKTLWVTGVQPTEVDSHRYIPTALFYGENGQVTFGFNAHHEAGGIVNNNFKIDLGDITPGSPTRKYFPTEHAGDKTAYELTKDFFELVLSKLDQVPVSQGEDQAKILVAEPLNFQLQDNYKTWVQNYRGNLRRILHRFEEVEFLPEPFAVYQYYRYGQRIPHLQDKAKHIALVLDFGGGTFDACIIESTNQGDISLTGKHSKPLGADSTPIGGYFVNQCLAEYLIKRGLDLRYKADADNCIKNYQRIRAGELDPSTLNQRKQNFIKNYRRLINCCEQYKIDLVSAIAVWHLDNNAYERIMVKVPADPFEDGDWVETEFFAHQLRSIFVDKVWAPHLVKVLKKLFKNSEVGLAGRDISITLISGGSSNIRWMLQLLKRDFEAELSGAEPVPITQSFQEVVATGLAIECARRFYDEESEFVGVTYNPIRLSLDPDEKGAEVSKNFISLGDKIDMKDARPGDLMPSASALNNFLEEPLQWRIKLSSPPKSKLKYVFSKPSEEGVEDIYNAESQVVYTRDNKQFDSSIVVQLIVEKDGTAKPTFIYKLPNADRGALGNIVEGKAFAIDMTSPGQAHQSLSKYIGFDFGTSSSAVCVITKEQVKTTHVRSSKESWLELSEALSILPYPVAFPLRKYLDVKASGSSATVAREAFEAALAFIAYAAAAESLTIKKQSSFFKGFQHRSMGPLKDLLERSLTAGGGDLYFCAPLSKALKKHKENLDRAVKDFTDHKHEKLADDAFDSHGHLYLAVNLCLEVVRRNKFGYVADSRSVPFNPQKISGVFKVASDIQPFIESFSFKSTISYPKEVPLIVNVDTGKCLPLFPLMFWSASASVESGFECYWFDKPHGNSSNVKVKPCSKKDVLDAKSLDLLLDEALIHFLECAEPMFEVSKIDFEFSES